MSTSTATIKSSLAAKLSSVDNIAEVIEYATGNYDNYPVAEITHLGGASSSKQNVRRLYEYRYRVEVFIEQGSNFDAAKTERLVIETIDQVLTVLNADITLGGGVLEIRPISWDTSYEARELDMRILSMELAATKLETIS